MKPNQFSLCFSTIKHIAGETYFLEGQKYLAVTIARTNLFLYNHPFPTLLIPDDNSLLANSIRHKPKRFFKIPCSDLNFRPKSLKRVNKDWSVFLIKNTDRVQKITEEAIFSPQILTFKVQSHKKTRSKEADPQTYHHWLEIEPFSWGLEGLPEISKIKFSFDYGQSLENSPNSLIKTSLYNHPILTESVGKTFTMRVKNLGVIGEEENGKGNENVLLFNDSGNFEIDKFLQENPVKANNENNSPPPSLAKIKDCYFLLIGLIMATLLGVIIWWKIKKS